MSVVVDSYSEANYDDNTNLEAVHPSAGALWSAVSQSFLCSVAARLTSCKFYVKKTGSPVGNLRARLYAHTGTYGTSSVPTGAVLDESASVAMAELGTSYALVTFTFTGGYMMQPNTNYCIVLYANDATTLGAGNSPTFGDDASTPSHGGNMAGYKNSSWNLYAAYDMCFYVYGTLQQRFTLINLMEY